MLPNAVKVDKLEVQHQDYKYYKPIWQTIADLREGATAIVKKANSYLPKRPGEQEDVYQLRLAKISYTPVMSTAIREFTAKLASAPVHIEYQDEDFLKQFRDSTDGKGRDENELLNNIFSTLLYFGRVFVAIDRPKLGVNPRSAFEELGLANQPYVSIYEPLDVINWGEGWYITRQIITANQPLQEPNKVARWTVWDAEAITVYESAIKTDDRGFITDILVAGVWSGIATDKALVPTVSVVKHGLGKCPLVSLTLPNEMWTGNNVYLKQLQHFRIESSWTDAGVMAGTIQRVFTPMPAPPADDPRVVYEEPDYSEIKADNAHVLVGAGFQFVESSGSAIASLTTQLETIERQIRAIVSMSQASVSAGDLEQSGKSKEADMMMLQDTMKAYGSKVAQLYQDILQLVTKLAGKPDDISVYGLDAYSVDTLGDMLDQTQLVETVAERIPTTGLKLWYAKITNLLAGSRSAETDQQIAEELDELFRDDSEDLDLDPDDPDSFKALKEAIGRLNSTEL